jgi:hypothetical protein
MNQSQVKPAEWIEVRDHVGKMLFKYNPWENVIEIQRGSMVYDLIKLDEIRVRFGVKVIEIPEPPAGSVTVLPASSIDR